MRIPCTWVCTRLFAHISRKCGYTSVSAHVALWVDYLIQIHCWMHVSVGHTLLGFPSCWWCRDNNRGKSKNIFTSLFTMRLHGMLRLTVSILWLSLMSSSSLFFQSLSWSQLFGVVGLISLCHSSTPNRNGVRVKEATSGRSGWNAKSSAGRNHVLKMWDLLDWLTADSKARQPPHPVVHKFKVDYSIERNRPTVLLYLRGSGAFKHPALCTWLKYYSVRQSIRSEALDLKERRMEC